MDDMDYFKRKIGEEKEKMRAILNNLDRLKKDERKALDGINTKTRMEQRYPHLKDQREVRFSPERHSMG